MRCGGCGAKLGNATLQRALSRLRPANAAHILVGLDAPDDAAVVEVPDGKVLVHSVDFFRAFIDDPYRLGYIAANHCLGDIYAMGAEPDTALAIATLPHAAEDKMEEDLYQMLAGALACFSHAVLSGPAMQRLEEVDLKQVVVTDTIPLAEEKRKLPKLIELSVANLLGEAMARIHSNSSVSSLFV